MKIQFPSPTSVWEDMKVGDKVRLSLMVGEREMLLEHRFPFGHAEWPGDPRPGELFRVPMVFSGRIVGDGPDYQGLLLFDLGPEHGHATLAVADDVDYEVLVVEVLEEAA